MAQLAHSATHRKVGGSNPPRGITFWLGFPGGSDGEESACNAGALGQEDSQEKRMATHSRVLSWRIPWTEDPGGLQSMGSQTVGHGGASDT